MAQFASFREFYPYYLAEHANRTCRRLHVVGSTLVIACLVALAITGNPWWILAALLCGYGFAWIGHFFFEHNKPGDFHASPLQLHRRLGDVPRHADRPHPVLKYPARVS